MKEKPHVFEFALQRERVKKILHDVVYKLKLLSKLPTLLEDKGEVLRKFLNATEVDFILVVCQETTAFSRQTVESRSDLILICNMLEKININDRRMTHLRKMRASEDFDIHIAYAVDIIFRCKPLVAYMDSLHMEAEEPMSTFIEAAGELERIATERLNISAKEELRREQEMKLAYRQSVTLTQSIDELEDLLLKQRDELTKEHDRKEAVLAELTEKLDELKTKCAQDIKRIVYDSEVVMMKNYLKSSEQQEELSTEAKRSTKEFDSLLEEHLQLEKSMRAKRLKVETQLASWVAKYDTDIGEKQAEYDALDGKLKQLQDELQELQDKLDDQEEEYFALLNEKTEEEERMMQEKAWIFLQNRAARRIQRAWRAYKLRKLARKKGRKSKKKGDKEGSAKGKKSAKSPESPTAPSSAAADPTENVLGEIK